MEKSRRSKDLWNGREARSAVLWYIHTPRPVPILTQALLLAG